MTEENGEREAGFSLPMTEANDGQSVSRLAARSVFPNGRPPLTLFVPV